MYTECYHQGSGSRWAPSPAPTLNQPHLLGQCQSSPHWPLCFLSLPPQSDLYPAAGTLFLKSPSDTFTAPSVPPLGPYYGLKTLRGQPTTLSLPQPLPLLFQLGLLATLQHSKLFLSMQPLHLLFHLPETLSTVIFMTPSTFLFSSFLREAFLIILSKIALFPHSTHHYLAS